MVIEGGNRQMQVRDSKGLTLVEIVLATSIFVTAVVGLVGFLISSSYLIDITRDRDVAILDLRNIMEKIRATPFDSITSRFPDAVTDGSMSNPYSTILGGYSLINEHITVSYADVNADPLEISVAVTWQCKRGRSHSSSMSTFRTR